MGDPTPYTDEELATARMKSPKDRPHVLNRWLATVDRDRAEIEALRDVIRGVLTPCRECRDELPIFADLPAADFIVWGKLVGPDALGPKCYDHTVKHLPGMPERSDQYAVVDLRPLLRALETGT